MSEALPPVGDLIWRLTNGASPEERRLAAEHLGKTRNQRAVSALIDVLVEGKEQNENVLEWVIASLADLRAGAAAGVLKRCMDMPIKDIQWAVRRALALIQPELLVPTIGADLVSSDSRVRRWAYEAVAAIGDVEALGEIRRQVTALFDGKKPGALPKEAKAAGKLVERRLEGHEPAPPRQPDLFPGATEHVWDMKRHKYELRPDAEIRRVISYKYDTAQVKAMKRMKKRCQMCEQPFPLASGGGGVHAHGHHIISRASGGPDTPDNILVLCPTCHGILHHCLMVGAGSGVEDGVLTAHYRDTAEQVVTRRVKLNESSVGG